MKTLDKCPYSKYYHISLCFHTVMVHTVLNTPQMASLIDAKLASSTVEKGSQLNFNWLECITCLYSRIIYMIISFPQIDFYLYKVVK